MGGGPFAENRLVSVSGAVTASFVYDGDGRRVKSTIAGTTTYFVGNIYEQTGTTVTKYYYLGGQRVAMRQGSNVYYLLSDHLGSTTVTTDVNGAVVAELHYKPWGEVRSGTAPTNYTFTGQYSNTSDFGLMFYNARWMDPSLGRFASADSVVPPGIQGYDRYAYANNNPVSYTDPTGHWTCADNDAKGSCMTSEQVLSRDIEDHFAVETEGNWDEDQLLSLNDMLGRYSRAVGGSGNLKLLLQQVAGGLFWNNDSRIVFELAYGRPPVCGGKAYACWDNRNRVTLSTAIWTDAYLDVYLGGLKSDFLRPIALGLHDTASSALVTMAHELTHVMADGFQMESIYYALHVDDPHAFGRSWEESLSTAVAIFVVSGGQEYPGYEDQMDFAGALLQAWHYSNWSNP